MHSPQGKVGLQHPSSPSKSPSTTCSPKKRLQRSAWAVHSPPCTPRQPSQDNGNLSPSPGNRTSSTTSAFAGSSNLSASRLSLSNHNRSLFNFGPHGSPQSSPHASHVLRSRSGPMVVQASSRGGDAQTLDNEDDEAGRSDQPNLVTGPTANLNVSIAVCTDATQPYPSHVPTTTTATTTTSQTMPDSSSQATDHNPNVASHPLSPTHENTLPQSPGSPDAPPTFRTASIPPAASKPGYEGGLPGTPAAHPHQVPAAAAARLPPRKHAMGLPTAQELAAGWSGFRGLLGGMVTRVTGFPATLQAMRAAAAWPGQEQQEGPDGEEEEEEAGEGSMGAELEAIEQEMAQRDAAQLVAYLRSEDPNLVQGALVIVMDWLHSQRLTPTQLLDAGLAPVLASLIGPRPSETTTLALEALGSLLYTLDYDNQGPRRDEDDDYYYEALSHVVTPLLHVMHVCLGPPVPPVLQYAHVIRPGPDQTVSSDMAIPATGNADSGSLGRSPSTQSVHGAGRTPSILAVQLPEPTPPTRAPGAPTSANQLQDDHQITMPDAIMPTTVPAATSTTMPTTLPATRVPGATPAQNGAGGGGVGHHSNVLGRKGTAVVLIRNTEERYRAWDGTQPRRARNGASSDTASTGPSHAMVTAGVTTPVSSEVVRDENGLGTVTQGVSGLGGMVEAEAEEAAGGDGEEMAAAGQWESGAVAEQHRLHGAFFAATAAMRLARVAGAARLVVRGGALPLLCSGLTAADVCLRQVCLFALYKLVHVGSHADNLVAVMEAGGAHALRALMAGEVPPPPQQAHSSPPLTDVQHVPAGTGTGMAAGVGMTAGTTAAGPGAGSETGSTGAGTGAGAGTGPPSGGAGSGAGMGMRTEAGVVAGAAGGAGVPVRDMAAAVLLDVALLPEAPAHAADHGLVAPLVQLLREECDPATRMYSLLVLARLANHSLEVQLDTVREGAVPCLIAMMRHGGEDEALHAARLVAILAQSPPTHEALGTPQVMAALTPLLASPNPLVVEHAASVFAIMANNPDTHFQVVGWGVVPLLVSLLSPTHASDAHLVAGGGKTQTYVLATLLLLAMHEPRHADVVCRSGAIPHLVRLVHVTSGCPSSGPASVREYAAAVISCLCRNADTQMEVISAGGVPALVQLLGDGTTPTPTPAHAQTTTQQASGSHQQQTNGSQQGSQAQGHAAEALVQLAAVDGHRKRLIVRATEILRSLHHLLCCEAPPSRYWGATLLQMLCQDDAVLQEVCDMPELLSALTSLLQDQTPTQPPEVRRAQVQAAWLVAALSAARPDVGATLAAAGAVRSLSAMLAAGADSVLRGAGGALHVPLAARPPAGGRDDSESVSAWPAGRRHGGSVHGAAAWAPPGGRDDDSGAAAPESYSALRGGAVPRRVGAPLRIEPLDSNGHAAAVAALLALARCGEDVRGEVEREVIFQEVWCGRRVRLEGLSAPFTS